MRASVSIHRLGATPLRRCEPTGLGSRRLATQVASSRVIPPTYLNCRSGASRPRVAVEGVRSDQVWTLSRSAMPRGWSQELVTEPATLLVQGVNARTVMDIMGWTEARMLSRYQHVVDELRRDAAPRSEANKRSSAPDAQGPDPEITRSGALSRSRLSESNR